MNNKERFNALFNFKPLDRIPVYFFGSWPETKTRWRNEGLDKIDDMLENIGPQVPGMDPDWEKGLWDCHGLVSIYPKGDVESCVIEENKDHIIRRSSLGEVYMTSKLGSSIAHTIEFPLKPSRESWNRFAAWLDPEDPSRWAKDWQHKAENINKEDRVIPFIGGSFYGYLRSWLGVEQLSLLMYDDPILFEDMVCYLTDYYIKLMEPLLRIVKFDIAYIFEDCCGSNGPLFSPNIYMNILDKYYKKLLGFYKSKGVGFSLIDSDGNVDKLVPCWLESGFDIIFPVEVGVWGNSPVRMREKFGSHIRMMGGVNKHVIAAGEEAVRRHLTDIRPEVMRGGYLPIPDHRIPPDCSYIDFLTYLRVFNEIFNDTKQE